MPRLTNLDEVLFPVAEHPVFVSVPNGAGERRVPVPDKKAIVNMKRDRVLGVVSRGYRLVPNRQALDWAFECCRTVFPETQPGEWEVNATDAPGTGGHCTIDLTHNSTALDFSFVPASKRPDAFGPFIRVSNSYNGLRALGFDVGFYRKVCKNGLVLRDSIIRFKFTHLRRDIGETVRFEVAHERLTAAKNDFREYLGALQKCAIGRVDFDPLLRAVLRFKEPTKLESDTPAAEDWASLTAHLTELADRYAGELGENAYAVFNAVTDFASHPPQNRHVHRDRHSYQRLAGTWLADFSENCRQPDFALARYLEELKSAPPN